ncbi:MAG: RsmB/NOP family class I SAM-dependent RNA methyltransferase [Nanoarchaeota archaeon]
MPTEPIPNREKIMVKPAFIERYRQLLGKDYDKFMEYSFSYIRKAIRVNTLKSSVEEVKNRLEKKWHLVPVPWCKEGFWITFKGDEEQEKRFDIGNLIEHAMGYIYVQDPASMIPPVVLDPKPGELVLDMCAAPGSKTSQLAQYMENEGIIIANDIAGDRLKPLGVNLQRCGVANTVITLSQGRYFLKAGLVFDRVLVDAPCSGTGTIRRSFKTLQMWSSNLIRRLVHDQRILIDTGYQVLKNGGILVYSTCTHEPEENEGIVSWLLEKYPDARLEEMQLDINRSTPMTAYNNTVYSEEVRRCLRIYPFDNDTEGFFVARIRKG